MDIPDNSERGRRLSQQRSARRLAGFGLVRGVLVMVALGVAAVVVLSTGPAPAPGPTPTPGGSDTADGAAEGDWYVGFTDIAVATAP